MSQLVTQTVTFSNSIWFNRTNTLFNMSNSIQFQPDISVSPKNYSKSYNRKGQIGRVLNKNILEFNQKLENNANGCKIPLNGEIRNALAIKSHKVSIKNQMDVQIHGPYPAVFWQWFRFWGTSESFDDFNVSETTH